MLSTTECKMLEWMGRNIPFNDDAVIVDAGSFLGGSTAALAAGLSENPSISSKEGRIHSYDMFLAPNDAYSQALIGHRPAGSSTLDIFEANLGDRLPLVSVHSGDFAEAEVPDAKIDVLFIDVAKTWELNQRVLRAFFPRMVPGRTIIVQQDHNDQSCEWVNVTMEFFADYFEYLTDDGSSRVFLYTTEIPPSLLNVELKTLSVAQKVRLGTSAATRSRHPVSSYLSLTSVAWLIAERSFDEARDFLTGLIPSQPWVSDRPYVENIKAALSSIEATGHDKYIEGYFKAA
jgi:hypothetical protein